MEIDYKRYHGGNVDEDVLDFSISVNPYKPDFTEEIYARAGRISDRYIYYDDLDEKLSGKIGSECRLCAGTTESLYLLFMAFDGNVLLPDHCYGEYSRTAAIFNRKFLNHRNPSEIAGAGDLVFLCNPESPTGYFYDGEYVSEFVKTCLKKNAVPVIDDAFIDFVENHEPVIYDGAVHLRTFTKIYGLPGIRTAYFVDPYGRLEKFRIPWSLGAIGKAFCEKILDDDFSFPLKTLPLIWGERKRISNLLNVETSANYFFTKVNGIETLKKELKDNKIAVRDCESFGYPCHIRFGIRKPHENDRLLEIITRYVEIKK